MNVKGFCFSAFILFLVFGGPAHSQVFIPFSYWGCANNNIGSIFTDGTVGDFSGGTATNMAWNGTAMALTVGQSSGTYTSRPFDKTTRCTMPPGTLNAFTKFYWVPYLPYGKELPASNELTTDYSALASSTLQTNIANIWHFNGAGAIASGTTITAQVGTNGKTANANGAGMTYATVANSKLNSAITFDGTDDYINVPYTQTGVNDYTIALWFKTASAGNNVFVQDRGSGAGKSLTLGIGNNPGGCAAGKVSYGVDSNTIYIGKCTTSTYNDGNWHHVVAVWDGTSGAATASAQFTIYMDGVAAATTNTTAGTAPNAPLTGLGNTLIGRHDAWAVNLNGSLDEVAMWTRPLSATEAQQLFQRGGNRIKYQLRACLSPSRLLKNT